MRWLAFLVVGCSAPAPLLPAPVLTRSPPAPAAATPPPSPLAPAAPLSAEPNASEPAPLDPNPEPPPLPRLLWEKPYSALGHPRLTTDMQGLERDDELLQWALGGSSDPGHPGNQAGYHPGTRVVVDVELLSRAPKGTTARLLRTARSRGYWPLRGCFEIAQRAHALGSRQTEVRLTLSAVGRVLGSRVTAKNPEPDYARCVQARLRAIDFSPGFTRKLDVAISLKEWPGHAPLPPRAPDDAPPTPAVQNLETFSPALIACYQAGLANDAKLWGRLALAVSLGDDGQTTSVKEVETRFPDPSVVACVTGALSGQALAAPAAATKAPRAVTLGVRLGQPSQPPAPAAPPAPESEGAPAVPSTSH